MSSIIGIPGGTVSNQFAAQQTISQLSTEQTQLEKLENEVSTGQALNLPSDNPSAALDAVNLQRTLDQLTQVSTNLTSSQSYLTQTDSALSTVSNLLNNAQSTASAAAGTTISASQQQQAADEIGQLVQQLVNLGNTNFDNRYLFAGSATGTQPFTFNGQYVEYNGNSNSLSNYSDVNQLFQTNLSGAQAFGAISTTVQGTSNLTPSITAQTPLADLNGGKGVAPGSIVVSDGTNSSVVDLTHAATIGDVAAAIEANPPPGRTVSVSITPTGLDVSLDSAGSGNLTITDATGGTTAENLGLFSTAGIGTGPLVGSAVDPILTASTPISSLLGTSGQAVLSSTAANSSFLVQANTNGTAGNGYAIQFIDDGRATAGNETVNVNSSAKTITVDIQSGSTTANDVINALNGNAQFSANFTASLNPNQPGDTGLGVVDVGSSATTAGGSGTNLDPTGLQIENGGNTYNINFSGDKTVGDLLNTLNGSGASVLAEINPAGTGINILSRLSGSDFSIGENGGQTAAQLGVRTFNGNTTLAQLNYGSGVQASANGPDFVIQRPDGTQLAVSVGSDTTIQDVINTINNDPSNQGSNQVVASLNTDGNGITLSTNAPSNGSAQLAVVQENGSLAAQELGLIPTGQSQSNAPTTSGTTQTLVGTDTNPQETDSTFNALVRLQTALQTGNQAQITRGMQLLTNSTSQLGLVRADLGVQEQSVTALQSSLTSQQNQLQSGLSSDVDVDMATAITNLTQQQVSYQASLEMTAQLAQITLINFLPPA
jgi:flagellin-like hook-associated protein FlgL